MAKTKENSERFIDVFNIKTGQIEPFKVRIVNNEFVFTAEDGGFLKYPTTMTIEEIKVALEKYALEHAHIPEAAKEKAEEEKKNEELLGQFD